MRPTDPSDHLRHEEPGTSPECPVKRFRRAFAARTSVRLHYHSSLEVNTCDGVTGSVRVLDRTFDLAKTRVIVLPPGTLHSYEVSGGGTIDVVHVALPLLADWINTDAIAEFARRLTPESLVFGSEDTFPLQTDDLPSDAFGVSSFVFDLLRLLGSRVPAPVLRRPDWLREVVDYTERHHPEPLSLERAATVAGLSRSVFARRFGDQTGSTFHRFLLQVRLEHARLLLERGLTVTDVAQETGFTDASHLIRHFRREFGCTPGRWRRGRDRATVDPP